MEGECKCSFHGRVNSVRERFFYDDLAHQVQSNRRERERKKNEKITDHTKNRSRLAIKITFSGCAYCCAASENRGENELTRSSSYHQLGVPGAVIIDLEHGKHTARYDDD